MDRVVDSGSGIGPLRVIPKAVPSGSVVWSLLAQQQQETILVQSTPEDYAMACGLLSLLVPVLLAVQESSFPVLMIISQDLQSVVTQCLVPWASLLSLVLSQSGPLIPNTERSSSS